MAIIKCKMCGGDMELAADKTFGTCEYCGSTMTLPRVSDDQRAAAFNRGNHFRRIGEFDKALSVYEHIVADDDNDAEAHWCCALCRFGIEYVEDPATYEWLPTCHRASFDSFLEDVDYLAALEHSDGITRRQYQKDAAKIAEVQRGILAASQNTEPYDVFISYKELDESGGRTRDSILAQEIYYRLKEKGWRVFFSRISLEDVPGTQYEPYIFAALNSAKVMIVVGTSAENLNAVWVKNEWSRFLSMMRKDRSKLLIPCYRDMDPYDLPEQLSVLMSYDMGRIGFIQDLIRGVDKVLSAEKKEPQTVRETVKETVVVQQSGGPNVTALLKRGQQALEDKDWEKAKGFFDQVLNMDAENAEAFWGLFLAGAACVNEQEYIERVCSYPGDKQEFSIPEQTERIEETVKACALKGYLSEEELRKLLRFDLRYACFSRANRQSHAERQMRAFLNDKNYTRAARYAKGDAVPRAEKFRDDLSAGLDAAVAEAEEQEADAKAAKQKEYEAFLAEAEKKARELCRQAEEKREADYQAACEAQEKADTVERCREAINGFQPFEEYKDSRERVEQCEATIREFEEQEQQYREAEIRAAKEKAEAWRKSKEDKAKAAAEGQAKKEKEKKRKTGLIAAIIVIAVAFAGFMTVTKVIIPGNQYKAADELFKSGQYGKAIAAFEALGQYKDSDARIASAKDAIVKAFLEEAAGAFSGVQAAGQFENTAFADPAFPTVFSIYKMNGVGYIVMSRFPGYEDDITLAVGVDEGLQCTGIVVIDHDETPGLGAVAAGSYESGVRFRSQFIGQNEDVALAGDGGSIDAITGATATSRAVTVAVATSIRAVKSLNGNDKANQNNPTASPENAGFSMRPSLDLSTKSGTVSGLLISKVSADGPAEKAGISENDVIIKINGETVKTPEEARALMKNSGQTITLEVYPGGKEHAVIVSLNGGKSLGLSVSAENKNLGLIVSDLLPGGVSERAGVQAGDMLLDIDGQPCMTASGFDKAMNSHKAGDTVDVSILRNGKEQIIAVTLGASDFGILENVPSIVDVNKGSHTPLFSVQAVGDLNTDTSFTWNITYEEAEYGFSVSSDYHTGDKDEDKGFFIETVFDEKTQVYTSTLWADGITAKANGCTCYCSVKDSHDWSMQSMSGSIRVK